MARNKITFLVSDAAAQIVGVAENFARLIADRFEVEIVGPDMGAGGGRMHGASEFMVRVAAPRIYRYPEFFAGVRRLARAATGEVIVAFKAYLDTLLPALLEKRRRGARVLVYLDELDSAVWRGLSFVEKGALALRQLHHPLDDVYFPLAEWMLRYADGVMCSSSALARRFNGDVIHFGVDTDRFRPQPAAAMEELRVRSGLAGMKVVLFGGAVRPHKGVEDILEAVRLAGREDLRLVVVGPETEFLRQLRASERYGSRIVFLGSQPREAMPEYLDLADLIVLPLRDTPLARTQVPCKVFEAMAMAKPVVATRVSDLPEILDGCGMTVPPGDERALADAIGYLLDHPGEAQALGRAAREKCIREYSRERTRRRLEEIIGRVLESGA